MSNKSGSGLTPSQAVPPKQLTFQGVVKADDQTYSASLFNNNGWTQFGTFNSAAEVRLASLRAYYFSVSQAG